jgi:hypothetical protein
MNNQVEVSTENGKWIFKKPMVSKDELMFYNSDYFNRIGFPDAEVSIVNFTSDGKMHGGIHGGYYENVKELTFPFRHFAFVVQLGREGKEEIPVENNQPEPETESKPSDSKPDLFDRISKYGVKISEKLQTYFKKTEVSATPPVSNAGVSNVGVSNNVDVVKQENTEEPSNPLVSNVGVSNVGEVTATNDTPVTSNSYYKVVIPIVNYPKTEIFGKHEREEAKLNQILKEEKVDKSLGKSKVGGPVYEVGNRYIRMCEKTKDWFRYEIESNNLPGTKMSKYSKMYTKRKGI